MLGTAVKFKRWKFQGWATYRYGHPKQDNPDLHKDGVIVEIVEGVVASMPQVIGEDFCVVVQVIGKDGERTFESVWVGVLG